MDHSAVAEAIADAYQPQGTGRPSSIGNAETLTLFLSELEAGVHMEPAAALAGLSPNTVRSWLKRGEANEEPFNVFLRAYKRARGNAEARITRNIIKASELPQYWAAGATYLERTYPDRWGRRTEDSSAPRIVVQIGARDSDVSVQIQAAPAPEQGNHNASYQTQRLGEPEE